MPHTPILHVYVNPGKRRQLCIVGIETRRDESTLHCPSCLCQSGRGRVPFTIARVRSGVLI